MIPPAQAAADLLARARRVIPGASSTLSKGSHNWPEGVAPTFTSGGMGCYLWGKGMGQKYVDWGGACASVGLGYGYPDVAHAVQEQAAKGASLTLPHYFEVELAERLVDFIPCAEMVRFCKTGSEACSAAIRIARGATKRDLVLSIGYHGWHDNFAINMDDWRGVPHRLCEFNRAVPYNDIEALEDAVTWAYGERPAAVIIEPTLLEAPLPGYLERLRELCTQHGTILIFDEIVCGYRWALAGGQEYFGVVPDMATFGKAMANGHAISCVVGRRDIMEDHARVISGTFGGETTGLAAALATLEVYQKEPVIQHMWRMGDNLIVGFLDLAAKHRQPFTMLGYPVHPKIVVTEPDPENELLSLFLQETLARGVLFHPGGLNVMLAHDDEALAYTLDVVDSAFRAMGEGARLKGARVREAFKRA